MLLGTLPDGVGHPWDYFAVRGTFLDARGPLTISDKSIWGFRCMVLTRGHGLADGPDLIGPSSDRPVYVAEQVWVGSGALLYNCRIHPNVIVAAGAVVRSCEVGPNVVVAGNPAQVVARLVCGEWIWHGERYKRLV